MSDVIDHRLIGALHVEAVREQGGWLLSAGDGAALRAAKRVVSRVALPCDVISGLFPDGLRIDRRIDRGDLYMAMLPHAATWCLSTRCGSCTRSGLP